MGISLSDAPTGRGRQETSFRSRLRLGQRGLNPTSSPPCTGHSPSLIEGVSDTSIAPLFVRVLRLLMLAQLVERIAKEPTRTGKIVLISRDARLLEHDPVEEGPTLAMTSEHPGSARDRAGFAEALVGSRQVAPKYGIARQHLDELFSGCKRPCSRIAPHSCLLSARKARLW